MNEKQVDTLAKFLSDISKGLLIGSALGFFSDKVGGLPSLALALAGINTLFLSLYLLKG